MTSVHVEASRQASRAIHQTSYQGCPHCQRRLSIAEQIERHCDDCGKGISPKDIREEKAS